MSAEPRKISNEIVDEGIGSLGGCFVDGNPEQRSRERKLRRRSLAISIVLQASVVAAVILIPLFAKTERISASIATPLPPYRPYHAPSHPNSNPVRPHNAIAICLYCAPARIPVRIDNSGPQNIEDSNPFEQSETTSSLSCPGCIPMASENHQPRRPDIETIQKKPKTVLVAHIDPALLTHRVDPIYPTLPRQIRRQGRIELSALIATDGTIQSLHVVSGDPMFYESALAAVRQWIYKPTYLNGQPVQIETNITVIYTLAH